MTRVEIPPEGPEDPGHLLEQDEWDWVVATAHNEAAAQARKVSFTAALAEFYLPAKYHGGSQIPTIQVIHDAETPLEDGYAVAIGRFFQAGPAAGTSAFKMIDPHRVVRMLSPFVVAYAAGPKGNPRALHYEQAGYARFTRAQWTTADGLAQLELLAAELASDGLEHGIPDRHLTDAQLRAWAAAGRPASLGGRCTHDQIHRVLGGTTHTDPTPNYPLDLLNAAVTRHRNPAPAPDPQEDEMTDAQMAELKKYLRDLTGAGGGKTVTGVTETAYNGLHADLAGVKADLATANAKLDALATKPAPTPGA
jgi:hypothetical protein